MAHYGELIQTDFDPKREQALKKLYQEFVDYYSDPLFTKIKDIASPALILVMRPEVLLPVHSIK